MKKTLLLLLFILLLSIPAAAQDPVLDEISGAVLYGEDYMVGKNFIASVVTEPVMMDSLSSKLNLYVEVLGSGGYTERKQVAARIIHAEEGEILISLRFRLRNLTHSAMNGLAADSMVLRGYLNGQTYTFEPEVAIVYDTASDYWNWRIPRENTYWLGYTLPDNDVVFRDVQDWTLYKIGYEPFEPLQMIDVRLVYRVNPIIGNWELVVDPHPMNGETEFVRQPVAMQLETIRDQITGEVYQYQH